MKREQVSMLARSSMKEKRTSVCWGRIPHFPLPSMNAADADTDADVDDIGSKGARAGADAGAGDGEIGDCASSNPFAPIVYLVCVS